MSSGDQLRTCYTRGVKGPGGAESPHVQPIPDAHPDSTGKREGLSTRAKLAGEIRSRHGALRVWRQSGVRQTRACQGVRGPHACQTCARNARASRHVAGSATEGGSAERAPSVRAHCAAVMARCGFVRRRAGVGGRVPKWRAYCAAVTARCGFGDRGRIRRTRGRWRGRHGALRVRQRRQDLPNPRR